MAWSVTSRLLLPVSASREAAVKRMPSARYELRGVVSGPDGPVGDTHAAMAVAKVREEKSASGRDRRLGMGGSA
jgi:hypothetical protein